MKKVFKFKDRDSFNSKDSEDFAKILHSAAPSVQVYLDKSFGIRLQLGNDPIKVFHTGTKIGMGSFDSIKGETHFVIAPKHDSLNLKKLINLLGKDRILKSYIDFGEMISIGPVEEGEDNFSPAFLIRLLDDIILCSSNTLNTTSAKKTVYLENSIKGKPLFIKSFKHSMLKRKMGFFCEVLDDKSLRDYATVLLETAYSIVDVLSDWDEIFLTDTQDYIGKLLYISSKFRHRPLGGLSNYILNKTCRPPFPYGMRETLYKCLKYWEWSGKFSLAELGHSNFSYSNIIIQLDQIFEEFVGLTWYKSSEIPLEWIPKKKFDFKIRGDGGFVDKTIVLDHIFFDRKRKASIVIDAKYKLDIGKNEDLFQMVSYMDFVLSYEKDIENVIGVLVYPGDEWEVTKVDGFTKEIYCIKMPIMTTIKQEAVNRFLSNSLLN